MIINKMDNNTNDDIFIKIIKIIGSNIIYIILLSFLISLSVLFLFRYFNTSEFYEIEIEFNETGALADITYWLNDDNSILSKFVNDEITNYVCFKNYPGLEARLFLYDEKDNILFKDSDAGFDVECLQRIIRGFLPTLEKSPGGKTLSSAEEFILNKIDRYFTIRDYLDSEIFLKKINEKLLVKNIDDKILSSKTNLDTESIAIPGRQKIFFYQLTNIIEVDQSSTIDSDTISKIVNETINDYFINFLTIKLEKQIASLEEIVDLSRLKIKQNISNIKQGHLSTLERKIEYLNLHLENSYIKNISKNQISFDSGTHYTNYNFKFFGSDYIKELIDYTINEKNNFEEFYKFSIEEQFIQDERFEDWLNDNYNINYKKLYIQSFFNTNISKTDIYTNEYLYSFISFIISFFLMLIFLVYRKLIND